MPRKKKDEARLSAIADELSDNVAEFPTSAQDPAGRTEEQVDEANKLSVQIVDKNRQKGLQTLDKKCWNFDQRKALEDGHVENALRDLEGAVKAATTTLEALNSLTDMLRHDLMNTIENIAHQAIGQFQLSANLQTLLELLKAQGVITDAEMEKMWDKVVKSRVQEVKGEDPSK